MITLGIIYFTLILFGIGIIIKLIQLENEIEKIIKELENKK